MIRDTTRNPGTEDAPNYRRRRSASFVPAVRWDLEAAERAFEAQRLGQRDGEHRRRGRYDDPLAALPVIPKPVRRSWLRPSLKRFMSGRSSLGPSPRPCTTGIVGSGPESSLSQSVIWAGLDQRAGRRVERTNRTVDLQVAVCEDRVCRTTLYRLFWQHARLRYADIEDVYIFFKAAEARTEDQRQSGQRRRKT